MSEKTTSVSKRDLVSALEAMASCVDMDDSLEGTITYSKSSPDRFDVVCRYRVGNSLGQGGMFILGGVA